MKRHMTERPIIFSGSMVRTILERQKTQTRRVCKPQPHPDFLKRGVAGIVPQWPLQDGVRWFMADGCSELVKCPYGKPGDLLWVREAWGIGDHGRLVDPCLNYRANGGQLPLCKVKGQPYWNHAYSPVTVTNDQLLKVRDGWRSSRFMPRWASRITLEITEVRVQRVQEISEEDAEAEGITGDDALVGQIRNPYRTAYADLWDSINAKRGYPWDSNPWLWAITFRRLKP